MVDEASVEGRTAVVIDVIRATSTLVEALANGARAIFPTVSTEEAVKLASSLGREDTLLCGERKGLKIEGFDLGNSPAEFTPEVVAGKAARLHNDQRNPCLRRGAARRSGAGCRIHEPLCGVRDPFEAYRTW